MKPKTISFIPSPALEDRINKLTGTLRTSKAGLSEIALDFVTDRLLKGGAKMVNGKIELSPEPKTKAA